MRGDFTRVRMANHVWLSACGKCGRVLNFGDTVESLHDAEDTHDCHQMDAAAAEVDDPPTRN